MRGDAPPRKAEMGIEQALAHAVLLLRTASSAGRPGSASRLPARCALRTLTQGKFLDVESGSL